MHDSAGVSDRVNRLKALVKAKSKAAATDDNSLAEAGATVQPVSVDLKLDVSLVTSGTQTGKRRLGPRVLLSDKQGQKQLRTEIEKPLLIASELEQLPDDFDDSEHNSESDEDNHITANDNTVGLEELQVSPLSKAGISEPQVLDEKSVLFESEKESDSAIETDDKQLLLDVDAKSLEPAQSARSVSESSGCDKEIKSTSLQLTKQVEKQMLDQILYPVRGDVSSADEISEEEANLYRAERQIVVKGKNYCAPLKSFAAAGFSHETLLYLQRRSIEEPSPVQAQAIPLLLRGRSVLLLAPTGSGKTLAYVLPLIAHVRIQPRLLSRCSPRGLVLVPTRELAISICALVKRLVRGSGLVCVLLARGEPMAKQLGSLTRKMDIVIGTPARLVELVEKKPAFRLRHVSYLVVDEVDRLCSGGFLGYLERIFELVRPDRQLALVSATVQDYLFARFRRWCRDCVIVRCARTADDARRLRQELILIADEEERFSALLKLLGRWYDHGERILVFAKDADACESLAKRLLELGYDSLVMTARATQEDRISALARFNMRERTLMLCTALVSRGIDFRDVVLVVNYHAPDDINDYTHKVGRTARYNKLGVAISYFSPDEMRLAVAIAYLRRNEHIELSPQIREQLELELKTGKSPVGLLRAFRSRRRIESPKERSAITAPKPRKALLTLPKGNVVNGKGADETDATERPRNLIIECLEKWTAGIFDPIERDRKRVELYETVRRFVAVGSAGVEYLVSDIFPYGANQYFGRVMISGFPPKVQHYVTRKKTLDEIMEASDTDCVIAGVKVNENSEISQFVQTEDLYHIRVIGSTQSAVRIGQEMLLNAALNHPASAH